MQKIQLSSYEIVSANGNAGNDILLVDFLYYWLFHTLLPTHKQIEKEKWAHHNVQKKIEDGRLLVR